MELRYRFHREYGGKRISHLVKELHLSSTRTWLAPKGRNTDDEHEENDLCNSQELSCGGPWQQALDGAEIFNPPGMPPGAWSPFPRPASVISIPQHVGGKPQVPAATEIAECLALCITGILFQSLSLFYECVRTAGKLRSGH